MQKCLDSYSANRDPNLDRLSSLILGNINEFRVHIPYEITLDESIRLVNYWKRLSGVDSTQTIASYGATLPNLTSYRHPDAVVAEWIQNCHRHKAHSLLSISDYLQLPVDQMKRYRNLLRRLALFQLTFMKHGTSLIPSVKKLKRKGHWLLKPAVGLSLIRFIIFRLISHIVQEGWLNEDMSVMLSFS